MALLIVFDFIVRFIIFLTLIFLVYVSVNYYFIDTKSRNIKTIITNKDIITILLLTFVILIFDFFIFSVKPGDKKIKDEYCKNKKQ